MTHAVPEDDWKTRLRAELPELQDRMDKLHAFMQTKEFNALPTVERGDLLHQYTGMQTYSAMLARRIKRLDDGGS